MFGKWYDFMGVMVMCAWLWLVHWHFDAILVSLNGTIKFSLSLSVSILFISCKYNGFY